MGTKATDIFITLPVSVDSYMVRHGGWGGRGKPLCAKCTHFMEKQLSSFSLDQHKTNKQTNDKTNNKVHFLLMLKAHQNCGAFPY